MTARFILPLLLCALAASPAAAQRKDKTPAPKPPPVAPEPPEEILDDEEDPPATAPAASAPAPAPADDAPDIQALRQRYLALRDELFRSRARAAAVASSLYSSQVRIHLDYASGRFYNVQRATIRLDGANVYDDVEGAIARDTAPRFEGYVAPGRHVISIRIESSGKDDDRFTSTMEDTFVVIAPAGKNLVVKAKARDDGNLPYEWKRKERGSYKLHLDVHVEAVDAAKAKK